MWWWGRRVRYGPRPGQFGVWHRPRREGIEASPVVVLVHGGSWATPVNRWAMWLLVRDAARRGWAVFNVEYRRLGRFGGGGGWPHTFHDVRDAVDHITGWIDDQHGRGPGRRVAVVGHSAGGHLALWAAPSMPDPVVGIVSLAGPTDLESISRNGSDSVRALTADAPADDRWQLTSPIEHVPTGRRTLLVHGADDRTVSPKQSQRYVDVAKAAGDDADVVIVEGDSHRSPIDHRSGSWRAAVRALEEWFASAENVTSVPGTDVTPGGSCGRE